MSTLEKDEIVVELTKADRNALLGISENLQMALDDFEQVGIRYVRMPGGGRQKEVYMHAEDQKVMDGLQSEIEQFREKLANIVKSSVDLEDV